MGSPELAHDPRFASSADRASHGPELRQIIEGWTCQKDKTEVMEVLGRAGVPVGAVFSTAELQ